MNIDINVGQGDTEGREPRAHVVCFLSVHASILDQYPCQSAGPETSLNQALLCV